MQYSDEVTLLNPNKFQKEKKQMQKFLISACIIFSVMQSILLYVSLSVSFKQKIEIGLILFFIEGIYIYSFYKIKKMFKKNKISMMFFQSSFMSVGVMLTLAFTSPFIIKSFMHYIEIFNYYILGLVIMLSFSFLYVKSLDPQVIVDNSLMKNDGITIIFAPDTVCHALKKIQVVIYIPYVIALILAFYAFITRTGVESIRALTASMLLFSALLLYSEFCYFLLWMKYLIKNNR